MDIKNTCFFTGHRIISNADKPHIIKAVQRRCVDLIENHNVTDFICGGALGFDTLAAVVIIDLKKFYPQIKLHLYLPCTNQADKWSKSNKMTWEKLKLMADDYVFITNEPYVTGCMQLRNKAMVNDAYYGIAYCSNTRSGTYSTVKYALDNNRKVSIINGDVKKV